MASVLFVCLGNICRSPMAEGIARKLAREHGLDAHFDSAGTSSTHAGELPDPRTRAILAKYESTWDHRARPVEDADFERFDLLLAMDGSNLAELRRRCPPEHAHKLRLMLEPTGGRDVPDPYWGGMSGFESCYALLEPAVRAWVIHDRSA